MFVVSVDPATGSSSLPGFALWQMTSPRPQLVDCGTIKVKGTTHWQRMRNLSLMFTAHMVKALNCDEKNLELIKVLVIEGLAPVMGMSSGGKHFGASNTAFVHLHHAVAAICTSYAWPVVEELPVQTWKSFLSHLNLADAYVKSDMNDAIIIGVVWLCRSGFDVPIIPPAIYQAMFANRPTAKIDPGLWKLWHDHISSSRAKSAKAKASKKNKRGKT